MSRSDRQTRLMSWEGLNSADLARVHCGSNPSFTNLYSAEEIQILLSSVEWEWKGECLLQV